MCIFTVPVFINITSYESSNIHNNVSLSSLGDTDFTVNFSVKL
jgi:hypothetical protein